MDEAGTEAVSGKIPYMIKPAEVIVLQPGYAVWQKRLKAQKAALKLRMQQISILPI